MNNSLVFTLSYKVRSSPVQVSHLLQLVTKQLHYFYANQANKFNLSVYNIIKKRKGGGHVNTAYSLA